MRQIISWAIGSLCVLALGACTPNYSPDTYASNAVQLANRVEAGVVIGYRQVAISASGTIGAVTGGAAGGVLGAEYANSALATVAATAMGSVIGSTLDHAVGDTTGWEYIVRKPSGEMLSVTQREKTPLALGQKVLVIMGPQARVVPDYSVAPEPSPSAPVTMPAPEKKPEAPVKVEVVLSLPPGMSLQNTSVNTVPAGPALPQTPALPQMPDLQPEAVRAPPQSLTDLMPSVMDALGKLGLTPISATPAEAVPTPQIETETQAAGDSGVCAADGGETCAAPAKK